MTFETIISSSLFTNICLVKNFYEDPKAAQNVNDLVYMW